MTKLDLIFKTLEDYIDWSEREGGRYENHQAIREAKVWLIEYIRDLKEWTQHDEDCPRPYNNNNPLHKELRWKHPDSDWVEDIDYGDYDVAVYVCKNCGLRFKEELAD